MAAQETATPEPNAPATEAPISDAPAADAPTADSPAGEENVSQETLTASTGFVGQWRKLVSTTNWDKGQIICAWRKELQESGAPVSQYSDEAWAQIVGDVTGQHVGRLRRTYDRFGAAASDYEGLYWSHFQTALDWDDAEMWLEGALQNKWSVSQMRAKRWETVGDPAEATDTAETDPQAALPEAVEPPPAGAVDSEVQSDSDAGESAESDSDADPPAGDDERLPESMDAPAAERREPVRPMKDLAELPDDLAEAFEQFKLAILAHKMTDWSDVSREDVLASLEALKQLATAPSGE